jgi:hypothetical protein
MPAPTEPRERELDALAEALARLLASWWVRSQVDDVQTVEVRGAPGVAGD